MFLDPKDIFPDPYLFAEQTVDFALEIFKTASFSSLPVLNRQGEYLGVMCFRKMFFASDELRKQGNISSLIEIVKPILVTTKLHNINTAYYSDVVPVIDSENHFRGFLKTNVIANKINRYFRRIAEFERKLLESSYNGIIAIDNQGIIKVFNPAAERILGRKQEEMISHHISELDPNLGMLDAVDRMTPMTGIRTEINGNKIWPIVLLGL